MLKPAAQPFAFCAFVTHEDAARAILHGQGKMLNGMTLRLQWAKDDTIRVRAPLHGGRLLLREEASPRPPTRAQRDGDRGRPSSAVGDRGRVSSATAAAASAAAAAGGPCRFFNSRAGCSRGDACPFLHVWDDSRHAAAGHAA